MAAPQIRWPVILLALTAACARRYPVQGLVLSVDRGERTMVVSHRPISGFMPAMSMPFRVQRAEELEGLTPGARVNFDLVVSKRASVARRIRLQATRLDDVALPPVRKPVVGEMVPDFTLTDQLGRPVRLSDFRGRVVALDFIYTRCPLPDVCPRLSAGFAYVARRFPGAEPVLLSVSVDPEWDRPPVLAEYARRYQADAERWRFLTGTAEDVRRVATFFGLVYWPEEGAITHTVTTAVIGRDGRLRALIEGASFRPEQLRDLLAVELGS